MVESTGNEIIGDTESKRLHGMAESGLGNDIIMMDSEVPSNGGEMILDGVKDKAITCSEVDQNMKAQPMEMDLSLLGKSLDADRGEDGKARMEEVPEAGNDAFSGSKNMSVPMHDQEVMGKKSEAKELEDVSPVVAGNGRLISAEEETAGIEIAKADTINGNLSSVVRETVDDKSKKTVEGNCQTQASLDVLTASQDTEDCKGQIQEIAVEAQEHTNGFATSAIDFSAPASCQSKDADEQIASNVESLVEVCEQGSESSEQIGSSAGHVVEVQDCSNDAKMVDLGAANAELELVPDVPMSQSEDGNVQIGSVSVSGLQEADHLGDVGLHEVQDEGKEMDAGIGNFQNRDANEQNGLNVGTILYTEVEETAAGNVSLHQGQDVDEKPFTGVDKFPNKEEKNVKHVASRLGLLAKEYHATYELPPETSDGFSIFDLVWGKVKSHPWWPGQIFHPSDSSEKAMKYYRKDCYLLAYFGDRTFAWNEASRLKPFRTHFSEVEKQSSSEAFQNAVDCALEEVSRRVELGLACSCIPEESYDRIKFQIIENAGIQKDSSKREGGDVYSSAGSFQPDKLVDYVRSLAQFPTCGANRLELTVAKAQLLSISRLKGFYSLPEFQFHEGLLENDADSSLPQVNSLPSGSDHGDSVAHDDVPVTVKLKGPHRRKHNLKDIVYHRRKEKSFSEIMGDSMYYYDEDYDSDEKHEFLLNSPNLGRKRKASTFLEDEPMVPESTRTISLAKVSHASTPSPRQSFKIGDCIRRVASRLTGSPSTLRPIGDDNKQQSGHDVDKSIDASADTELGEMIISTEETSPDDFLWELNITAQDPRRGHGFSNSLVRLSSEFRDAVVSAQRRGKENSSTLRAGSGRKRKSSLSVGDSPETFEFDDRKDSYWTDMVVQNNSEDKQPSRRGRKRKDHDSVTGDPGKPTRKRKHHDPVTGDPEKPTQSVLRRHSRKQYSHGNNELAAEKSYADEGKHELPTELILNFSDISFVSSEAELNRMFRRFGPLKESETEVDRRNSRARVVFKNGSDAKIAYSSAATFNIFGPGNVNYQLGQIPSASDSSNLALTHSTEDAA